MWMKLLLFIHAYGITLYINCFLFFFGQVRTLVSMATFFIVVVIPGQWSDEVSVYKTIGPLFFISGGISSNIGLEI